jgi:hypothetical protein
MHIRIITGRVCGTLFVGLFTEENMPLVLLHATGFTRDGRLSIIVPAMLLLAFIPRDQPAK